MVGIRAGVKRKARKTRKKKPAKKKARTKASNSSKTKSGKPRKTRRKRKTRRSCASKTPYTVKRKDYAVMESVRQALGLPEPDVHWSREVREGLSLTGNPDDLDYFGDESPDEELPGFSSNGGIATRVLPRHLAVERLNLARRIRVKGGIELNSIASGKQFNHENFFHTFNLEIRGPYVPLTKIFTFPALPLHLLHFCDVTHTPVEPAK